MNRPGIIIVQARMGSKRLPGKTLLEIHGRTVLMHLMDALTQSIPTDRIWIATSKNGEDDAIGSVCLNEKLHCYRGDSENVASRFLAILGSTKASYFVRINADSPLLDHRLITDVIAQFDDQTDLVSTSYQRAVPSGMNVELVRATTYLKAYPTFSAPGHFEHVTQFFYEQADRFKIKSLKPPVANPGNFKFSLDDEADKLQIERIFAAMTKPHYQYTLVEKCRLYEAVSL